MSRKHSPEGGKKANQARKKVIRVREKATHVGGKVSQVEKRNLEGGKCEQRRVMWPGVTGPN